MNKVLLINSYFYKLDAKQWKFKQPYPPLGTLQAAAVIRQAGFETSVEDVSLLDGPEEVTGVISGQPKYVVIYDDGFNYLTKMCLTVMRQAAFRLAAMARQAGCKVIISSSDATDHVEMYLDHDVDYVIKGEGEITLLELLHSLESNNGVDNIPGLAFRKNGNVTVTRHRPVMRNLDELPMPAWDLISLDAYRSIWYKHHGYFSLNIATTRGCPYKCNWCAKPIYGNRYNSRSPEHVVNEISYLLTNHKPDHFWMCDDIFGLKPGWVTGFNNLTREKNLTFRYKIQSRVDLIVASNVVEALAESGCESVWVGAESGSQNILDAMDKETTLDEITMATALLKKNKIKVGYFLQFGYPGETQKEIDATIAMVMKEMPDEIGISISYPLPGTKFYESVKSQLQEKKNWTDSDDLAMLYNGYFSLGFYKMLQRYVHSRYRIQRGINILKRKLQMRPVKSSDFRKMASMIYHIPLSFIQLYKLRKLRSTHAQSESFI